ncbi:MAG: PSD1 and planctomycete cytochrome C domain-containing protein [Planctomycetota bacterium]
MSRCTLTPSVVLLALLAIVGGEPKNGLARDAVADEQLAFFEQRIRPVLVEHCYECHSADAKILQAGLRADTRAGMRQGGDSGPAVVPYDEEAGTLMAALRHETFDMPPSGKLPAEVIADFSRWVREGAMDPREALGDEGLAGASGVRRADGILNRIDYEHGRQHWAFTPPAEVTAPLVYRRDWVRTPVDTFVLSALESVDADPSLEADRATLLRRLSFDLVGLPPTPAELDAFLSDERPDAYERLVDRLLASPHYGERWGRHWLDVVRYSDSNGLDENYYFGYAWRYRDYVVRAFNADKPYDEFVAEQLAGDLLASRPDYRGDHQKQADALTATGVLAIGPKMQAERDNQKRVMDTIDELLNVTGQAFLGLSVACARCHDHKFDPIAQADYYAMAGLFRCCVGKQGKRRDAPLASGEALREYREAERKHLEVKAEDDRRGKLIRDLHRRIAERPPDAEALEKELEVLLSDRPELQREMVRLRRELDNFPRIHTMHQGKPSDLPVHIRGSHMNLADQPTPRGPLPLFDDSVSRPAIAGREPGRLQLAQWLTDPRHPLTARVMVNRIWQGHFGRGLVDTPNDFGYRGSPPTHPELLDFLAREFIAGGWSIKRMHRLILLSSTYRQSSRHRAASAAVDPENRLLWRQNRRRLEAEPIRDNLLAVAGLLDRTIGGRVFDFPNGERVTDDRSRNKAIDSYRSHRRAIYLPVIRVATYPMFTTFDLADPSRPLAGRDASVVAPQALYMMNGQLALDAASGFAERLSERIDVGAAAAISHAYRLAYGRSPTEEEQRASVAFLDENAHLPRDALWRDYCQALMAASEFIYID